MISSLARLLERRFHLQYDRTTMILNRLIVTGAAAVFILISTLILSFESIFPAQTSVESLEVGDIAQEDIFAPANITYTSDILTNQSREAARAAVRLIYDTPDPLVARQQSALATQILDFIDNVRRDEFASTETRTQDIHQITALDLENTIIQQILEIDSESWQDMKNQIMTVLESVFQGEIRDTDLNRVRALMPTRVSVRFDDRESAVIVAIVSDLIRPNTNLDTDATEAQQDEAARDIQAETRSFQRGQIVVESGRRITESDYEALKELGLLSPVERRFQKISISLLASIIAMVITGLYIARFRPSLLYTEPRMLTLLAFLFLIMLAGARLGLIGQIYLFPAAALALLYTAIIGPQISIIGVLGLAFLVGIMADSSLEVASLIGVGGIIGALSLRRSERLNSFFFAGLMVAVGNAAVAALFHIEISATNPTDVALTIVYALINGILTAAAALVGLYIVTLISNLPTALKLAELSQPNQPLLQRLLREAPGTYQHSLQVANLAEQAVNAIGGNAELTHVAALYHDIGKMLNPAFFTENQRYIGNPHDTLNDPYRSADIIISHVTGGDEMARQYGLPHRIREFIREHHGTTRVFVFYQQALALAGDDEALVDPEEFSYPGPKPRSKETGVLMLADSCEAAVRSRQPKGRQEIEATVQLVIEDKRKNGQLNESGLTLNDLQIIQDIFIDMLQAVFHPRLNYTEAVNKVRKPGTEMPIYPGIVTAAEHSLPREVVSNSNSEMPAVEPQANVEEVTKTTPSKKATLETSIVIPTDDDDNAPLAEVPRLRRTTETKVSQEQNNGSIKQPNETESLPE